MHVSSEVLWMLVIGRTTRCTKTPAYVGFREESHHLVYFMHVGHWYLSFFTKTFYGH